MALRRGFKSEANGYARELRQELGVAPHGALCPWRLAQHLEIPVFKLSEFIQVDTRAAYFLSAQGLWEFSGGTFALGFRKLIVINDGHSPKRQASDLSHELSHCVLHHAPKNVDAVMRSFDPIQEAEANWLGPALLISEEAALWIVRNGISKKAASEMYQVTEEIIQMRINLTGANRRIAVAS